MTLYWLMTNMTNTKTLAIVAVLTAATLVVGVTFAAAATPSAFAYKKGGDKEDGNTITAQINVQKGRVSGHDNSLEQEASNVICTHPHDECVSESG
jgi:hypothetical protein